MNKNGYLLDTYVFIWFLSGTDSMPPKVIEKICDFDNKLYISIASFWELAVKINQKKIELSQNLKTLIKRCEFEQIEILPLKTEHILKLEKLANHHQDHFDRVIIAQSIEEKLTVITHDSQFSSYPVKIFW